MANAILELFGTATALTITLDSLANVAGCVSNQVVNTADKAGLALAYFHFRSGAVAPTAGSAVEFYLARGDNSTSPHIDGGLAATNTSYTSTSAPTAANLRTRLQLVGVQPVTADTATDYYGSFVIPNPGPNWSLYVFNNIGQTLSTTAANFYVRYQTDVPEVQ